MKNLIRLCLFTVVAMLGSASVTAQVSPKPKTTALTTIHAKVWAASTYGIRVKSLSPIDGGIIWNAVMNDGNGFTTPRERNILLELIPGNVYEIFYSVGDGRSADFKINPPVGYTVVMGTPNMARTPRNTYYTGTAPNDGSSGYLMEFSLVKNDSSVFAPAGYELPISLGEISWGVTLGEARDGQPLGAVRWSPRTFGTHMLDARYLQFSNSVAGGGAGEERFSDGGLKWIWSPQTQLYVRRLSNGFRLEVYPYYADFDDSSGQDGDWTFFVSPVRTFEIRNPNATWQDAVQIVRTENGQSETWTLSKAPTTGVVTLVRTNNARTERIDSINGPSAGQRTETMTTQATVGGTIVAKISRTYQNFAWGEELVRQVVDPDGLGLETLYEYHTTAAGDGAYAKLKSIRHPDGSWERWDYHTAGHSYGELATYYKRWLESLPDLPATANTSNSHSVAYEYTGERIWNRNLVAATTTKILGVDAGRQEISYAFNANGQYTVALDQNPARYETVKSFTADGQWLTSVRAVFHHGSLPRYLGKLLYQLNPDGTQVSASVVRGGIYSNPRLADAQLATYFNVMGDNDDNALQVCETFLYGTSTQQTPDSVRYTTDGQTNGKAIEPIWLIPNKSVRKQVIRDFQGNTVWELTQVFTGSGFQLVAWNERHITQDGILYRTQDSRARRTEVNNYYAGRPEFETAVDGTQTQHFFDTSFRKTRSEVKGASAVDGLLAQPAVNLYYTYDSADRVIVEETRGTDGTSLVKSRTFNLAGLVSSETDPSGTVTSYAYSAGGRIVTVTQPSGSTITTEKYPGGTQKSYTGSGVVSSFTTVSTITSGSEKGFLVTRTYIGQSNGPRWMQTVTDWAGRTIREERPAPGTGSPLFQKTYQYNAQGRLTRTTETGIAATIFGYEPLGTVEFTALDVNGNGAIDLSGTDRVARQQSRYVNFDGAWWLESITSTYGENGSAAETVTGKTQEQLAPYVSPPNSPVNVYDLGNATLITRSIDIFGNVSTKRTAINRPSKLVTETTDVPDSNIDVITKALNGRALSAQNAQGHVSTSAYDSVGRLVQQSDPRKGNATFGYYAGTAAVGSRHQMQWSRDAAGNETSFTYDAAGRKIAESRPLGVIARMSYTARNELHRTWGSAEYPVEYGYNLYGEKTTMTTFQDGTGWSGASWPASPGRADVTTWNYEPATGVLTSKVDAAGRAVTYTYNQRSQLASRTWARGVVTNYSYVPETGEQALIDYSDSTPDISYSYNRQGLASQITDIAGTRAFEYCICGKPTKEVLPSGFYGDRMLTYQLDQTTTGAIGRTIGYRLGTAANPAAEMTVTYGYDTTGRLNSVSDGGASTFTYAYTPNSNLIGSITSGSYQHVLTYESNRDHLSSVDNLWAGVSQARFAYTVDALGRRTSVLKTGGMYASYQNGGLFTQWGYNDRSEVINETTRNTATADVNAPLLPGRKQDFDYDNIGNRKTSAVDGRTVSYTRNNLNQYTARSGQDYLDVSGLAPASPDKVFVNGAESTRSGQYFYQQLKVALASTPMWLNLNVGKTPSTKSLNGLFTFNWQGKPTTTPTTTLPTGVSGQVLQFEGSPSHVGMDKSTHGYNFENGRTYTFGFWARTLTGTRTLNVAITDNVNDGHTTVLHTIDTAWRWVSVTKTFSAVGANPRLFYERTATGADFQAYGAVVYENLDHEFWRKDAFVSPAQLAYTYDHDGNLLTDERWSYTWDGENRLIAMETLATAYNAGVPREKLEFRYDYLGRRVGKKVFNWSTTWTLVRETRFAYTGWNLIGEYAVSGTTLTPSQQYLWGLDISQTLSGAGGVKGLLYVKYASGATHNIAYDGNGNIVALVDRSTGTRVAEYEYTAFGKLTRSSGAYASINPFKFSTKYWDSESNLIYFGYRYYDVVAGQFIGRDPVAENGGIHLYAYLANRSVNAWDLLGLCTGVWVETENGPVCDTSSTESRFASSDDSSQNGSVYIITVSKDGQSERHETWSPGSSGSILERSSTNSTSPGSIELTGAASGSSSLGGSSVGGGSSSTTIVTTPVDLTVASDGETASREMIDSIIEASSVFASRGTRGLNAPGVNLARVELAMMQRIGRERDPVQRARLERDLANFRQANGIRPPGVPRDLEFRAPSSPVLVTNPKHHPNSRSPQPTNVAELYRNSIADPSGVRWSIDQNGVIHRFSAPSNGQTHWNGSTAGPRAIQERNIPNDIRQQLRGPG